MEPKQVLKIVLNLNHRTTEEESSLASLDATPSNTNGITTPRNGWKMLGNCSPSALFEASQRFDEQQRIRLFDHHQGAARVQIGLGSALRHV
mmetsp:Transcript_5301/g.6061  ORF Transcript_5301/g.6061 Transcript_5301/m.6061 type:complete len:92 (+) Transcript_5301:380-655(+)